MRPHGASPWPRRIAATIAAALSLLAAGSHAGEAKVRNGFALEGARVPPDQILRGGPPRDGIPALDHPISLPAAEAPWHEREMVIGVAQGSEARAYPIAILNWHELVNDTLGGQPILVTYCPLCGTGIVFDRKVAGEERSFGVSGLLYQSDLLLYDRESESLWSQISSEAITGPLAGTRLSVLRSQLTTLGRWQAAHPETTVLGLDTGHRRDYARSPYAGYARSRKLYFPAPLDRRYHPKMPTLGVRLASGAARAYPARELESAGGAVEEVFEGHPIAIRYDEDEQVFDAEVPPEVEVIEGFWFAWSAFHPHTSVFEAVSTAGDPK